MSFETFSDLSKPRPGSKDWSNMLEDMNEEVATKDPHNKRFRPGQVDRLLWSGANDWWNKLEDMKVVTKDPRDKRFRG